jgi:hypothetical protein
VCGGVFGGDWHPGAVFNSIVYSNSGGNCNEGTTLNSCCTTPLPTNGAGYIIGPPLFMDFTAGDYPLWKDSPRVDAAADLTVVNVGCPYESTDFLGKTRTSSRALAARPLPAPPQPAAAATLAYG